MIELNVETLRSVYERQLERAKKNRIESIAGRIERLKTLEKWIADERISIQEALHADLGKPASESDVSEIIPAMTEVRKAIRKVKSWSRNGVTGTSLLFFGTKARVYYEPKGVALVISAWNYPFLLMLGPVVSAIAAGNTVILKPSEIAPHVSALFKRMTEKLFSEDQLVTIEGGVETTQQLLALPFDHVFFTGSPRVGKIVMETCSRHLTSVTLELGGKSPAIVDETADLNHAAMKIAWGKWLNAGQTCVAPDYILVHHSVAQQLITQLKAYARKFYPSETYTRIISDAHFDRLEEMTLEAEQNGAKPTLKGKIDKKLRLFEPVIIENLDMNGRLMTEEIFGPILPMITYDHLDEVMEIINGKPKPLALYLFSASKSNQHRVIAETSSGGVVVNDCVLQFAEHSLPFGGIGNSGIGKSHGKAGFMEFSNAKSILYQRVGLTGSQLVYPPYTSWKNKLIDWIIKYF